MLRPHDKPKSNTQQRTCEHEQGKLKQQKEKAAYYARNPHLKWGK